MNNQPQAPNSSPHSLNSSVTTAAWTLTAQISHCFLNLQLAASQDKAPQQRLFAPRTVPALPGWIGPFAGLGRWDWGQPRASPCILRGHALGFEGRMWRNFVLPELHLEAIGCKSLLCRWFVASVQRTASTQRVMPAALSSVPLQNLTLPWSNVFIPSLTHLQEALAATALLSRHGLPGGRGAPCTSPLPKATQT